MAAEELDLKAQYERKPRVFPTVILHIEEGKLIATSGPRPVHREEYIHDWDTTWNEEGTDVVAVDYTGQFQKTVNEGQPVMVQRTLDEAVEEAVINEAMLGHWVMHVLGGGDPR
jgi:hypothetical protein